MKKDILAASALIIMLGVLVVFMGCRPFAGSTTSGPKSVKVAMVENPVWMYTAAGVGMMVFGALVVAFHGKGPGACLLVTGAVIGGFGHVLATYPWVILVAVMVGGAATVMIAYDRWRQGKTLGIIVEEVQAVPGGKQVKAGIKAKGPEVEEEVRRVIRPIKNQLAKAGKTGE